MEHTVSNDLLQYEDPIEIADQVKKEKYSVTTRTAIVFGQGGLSIKPTVEPTKDELEKLLNYIFPPEEFDDYEGNSYKQMISSKPAGIEEVKQLEQELNLRLRGRHARPEGLCNIRRELYIQVLNELIRQETIDFPERGLLLRRIRDEIHMTYSVFKSLFDSSVAYESRKSLMLETATGEYEKIIKENEPELVRLRKLFKTMQVKVEQAEIKVVEQAEADRKRRIEETEFHKTIGSQLKMQLEKILAPAPKQNKA